MVSDVHTRFPAVSIRQWNFWVRVSSFPSEVKASDVSASITSSAQLFAWERWYCAIQATTWLHLFLRKLMLLLVYSPP